MAGAAVARVGLQWGGPMGLLDQMVVGGGQVCMVVVVRMNASGCPLHGVQQCGNNGRQTFAAINAQLGRKQR